MIRKLGTLTRSDLIAGARAIAVGISALGIAASAVFASGGGNPGGTPGPCLTITGPGGVITYNVGGDVTLKASVTNCSSDTTVNQLIVIFKTIYGAGIWCAYPTSNGNPPNFSLAPGSTKSVSCTMNASLNAASDGQPADAEVYEGCLSFSTQQSGPVLLNSDGTRFWLNQGGLAQTCTLEAVSANSYVVVSGINANGIPRK